MSVMPQLRNDRHTVSGAPVEFESFMRIMLVPMRLRGPPLLLRLMKNLTEDM